MDFVIVEGIECFLLKEPDLYKEAIKSYTLRRNIK